jgi:hypothetical protein
MRLGIAQARRGWLEKRDVINTRGVKELLRLLRGRESGGRRGRHGFRLTP